MSWTSDCNHDQCINDLKSLLGKIITLEEAPVIKNEEEEVNGEEGEEVKEEAEEKKEEVVADVTPTTFNQFGLHYRKQCLHYKITACPFVHLSTADGKKILNVLHCNIDISSWQTMLLTMVLEDPPVTELVLHGSQLTTQHIINLREALEYKNTITIIKFTSVTFVGGSSVLEALGGILNSGATYINFKYCQLPSEMLLKYSDLTEKSLCPMNISLNILDLSGNLLDDAGASQLFQGLYMNVGLKYLSLKKNHIKGSSCLYELLQLLTGRVSTPEDGIVMKLVSKEVADHNKNNKEMNKIRKSNSQPEIPDLHIPDSRICKIGSEMLIVNRQMIEIDMSYNPIQYQYLLEMCQKMEEKEPLIAHDKANGRCDTKLIMSNLRFVNIVTYDQDRADNSFIEVTNDEYKDSDVIDKEMNTKQGLSELEKETIQAINIGTHIKLEL